MGYRKIAIVLTSLATLGILVAVAVIVRKSIQQPPAQNPLPPTIVTVPTPTSTTQASGTAGMKTYTNTEYGFEFRYPDDWVVKENTFVSYYSKFNLEVVVKKEKYLDLVFDVNIVMPEFPERSFKNIEKTTSEVIVDGVLGIKYQYEFESQQETAIVLPIGDYKVILGTDSKQDVDSFNQILASFKFLK